MREETSPKDAEQTVLHRIVREQLATFLARKEGEAGLHPEWPADRGFGSTPRTAVEDAVLAHRAGGLAAIADTRSPRAHALRALLETGFALPCDLRHAVQTGTLRAVQPFAHRDDALPWAS